MVRTLISLGSIFKPDKISADVSAQARDRLFVVIAAVAALFIIIEARLLFLGTQERGRVVLVPRRGHPAARYLPEGVGVRAGPHG